MFIEHKTEVSEFYTDCLVISTSLLPSIFPSIRVFSSELALCTRWPKYWSLSFSNNPSNEYSGLISFRIYWFDLTVQGTLKSLLQCMKVKSESEVAQSCPTLSDPMDCSLPGSSIHGIFQARVLEWVAICSLSHFQICNTVLLAMLYYVVLSPCCPLYPHDLFIL